MSGSDGLMNAWFIAAGVMLAGAFEVHVVAGTRFYAKARPERELPGRAPEDAVVAERRAAWMLGRCGFQLISVDLALSAGCFLALGLGLIPRNAVLELFLTLTYAGWGVAWRAVLAADCSPAACRHRLRHWVVFLAVALTAACGMAL